MEDNIQIDEVEFNQELYEKNILDNGLCIEYEAGDLDANN